MARFLIDYQICIMQKFPDFLVPGQKIGIVSPARKISKTEIEPALEEIKKRGFIPVLGKNIFSEFHQFAGTDNERTADFQDMLNNTEIKAILCARGGYGSVRIIERLDFSKFLKSPKWICGYSDITVFHSFMHQQFGCSTIHCTMPVHFGDPQYDAKSIDTLFDALTGRQIKYQWDSNPLNKNGKASGILVGGNLSILYSLRGTRMDLNTAGKILFFEDLDEYLYHIDRMVYNIRLGGMLDSVKAIVVGSLSDMKDNTIPYGKTAPEIVLEHTENLGVPVCFGAPAGHQKSNYAFILGAKVNLEVSSEKVNLGFQTFG